MNWNVFAIAVTSVILGAGLYVLSHYYPDPTMSGAAQAPMAGGVGWSGGTQVHGGGKDDSIAKLAGKS